MLAPDLRGCPALTVGVCLACFSPYVDCCFGAHFERSRLVARSTGGVGAARTVHGDCGSDLARVGYSFAERGGRQGGGRWPVRIPSGGFEERCAAVFAPWHLQDQGFQGRCSW